MSSQNGGHLHLVGGPLVVQCPRMGRRAHGERAARYQHLGRQSGADRGRRWGSGQHRVAAPQLVGGEHRLGVLLLVLGDHAEDEAALGQPPSVQRGALQQVDHPGPHLADVAARRCGVQQRQGRPVGAWMLEGVIQLVDGLRQDRVAAADVTQQPQLLLIADMRQVPDQRRHQPGMLLYQFGVVQRLGQHLGAGPGPVEVGDDPTLDLLVGAPRAPAAYAECCWAAVDDRSRPPGLAEVV